MVGLQAHNGDEVRDCGVMRPETRRRVAGRRGRQYLPVSASAMGRSAVVALGENCVNSVDTTVSVY